MADDNPIKNQEKAQAFVTWSDDSGKRQALADTSDNIDSYDGIQKAVAYNRRSFLDIEPNRSVRTGFTREDYNRFRGAESVPKEQKRAIRMCMAAYDKVGIIRNVIDLMADFAGQGITIVHPNKRIEKFFRAWFQKINGIERSERFLNTLYRTGNVVVKRRTAKISKKAEKSLRSMGEADMEIIEPKFVKKEIPWKFDFLNPLSIEVIGDELSTFLGAPQYALRVSKLTRGLLDKGLHSSTPYHKHLNSVLPPDIVKSIKDGQTIVPLDNDKVSVYHYKKDDWLVWANPMIYAILDDIIMLEKMKLADISALDGAISNIRLWSLGDLDNKILPTKSAINKLRNILASNVGGGTMDLVWGPELKFTESSTQVFRFLGKEKYEPVLTNIYAGLGVPPTLTGMAAGGGGGFTNNFISLKTLVERLEYGRQVLVNWWNQELEIVQKAMGFRLPARIHFDQMVLSDESSEKNLLIQLADRNIISSETLIERFGEIPEIEKIRIRREERDRKVESMPQKASPYHNPQHRNDLEKIALTKDSMQPEDFGLVPSPDTGNHPLTDPQDRRDKVSIENQKEEKEEKKFEKEQKRMELKKENQPDPKEQKFDPVGRPEDGRPKNAKDQTKRKQREVKPVGNTEIVTMSMWASDAQAKISETVNPAILAHYDKKSLRSLTKSEMDQLEHLKLCILCNIEPYMDVTPEVIADLLRKPIALDKTFSKLSEKLKEDFFSKNDRNPNIDEARNINVMCYALRKTGQHI
tara:strand:- start:32 stop:2287 length:2256 start_codon:yes stop_codon:yes gene_type:complete